ncbi:MAG: TRAP transporter small permease [Planctomycetota bacterium]|jgi:TRAP-type C4-dicarboxylate transport system permease small subunit
MEKEQGPGWKLWNRVDGGFAVVEGVIAAISALLMLTFISAPMVFRKLHPETLAKLPFLDEGDYSWMAQAARYALVWSLFAGASLATRTRRHIMVDIVTKMVPLKARAFLGIGANFLGFALCGSLTVVGAYVVQVNWSQKTVLHGMNSGPLHVIIPVALAIMALRFLANMVQDFQGFSSGDLAYLKEAEESELGGATYEGGEPEDSAAPAAGGAA